MRRLAVLVGCAATLAASDRVESQSLTRNDSSALRIAAFRILVDTEVAVDSVPRVWVTVGRWGDAARAEVTEPKFTGLDLILTSYPHARLISDPQQGFVCGPGERVMMPLSGCPIKDGGIIVQLGGFMVRGDTVVTRGTVMRSYASPRGTRSVAATTELSFVREERLWRLFKKRLSAIT